MERDRRKHLNTRRYAAEGYAACVAGAKMPDPFMAIFGCSIDPDPCPYTRWWKVRAWWRGYMRARGEAFERSVSEPFSLLKCLSESNTYQGCADRRVLQR